MCCLHRQHTRLGPWFFNVYGVKTPAQLLFVQTILEEPMSRKHVDHKSIVAFAERQVNLGKPHATKYRAQARRVREKLEAFLKEHPDFVVRKTLLSGSLAKGTALRSLNDIDLACYVAGADAPREIRELLDYVAERLRKAFPNLKPDQVQPQTFSVTVSFRGTGLDVDVVPILYDGDPEWYGNLVSQDDGSFLETCIPRHLEFVRARKTRCEDFAQVTRLIKYWVRRLKSENEQFRFKSFMVELILAHLVDDGLGLGDYPEALQGFFTYVARTGLAEPIVFTDYYRKSEVESSTARIQIIDPVNPKNNVSSLYTSSDADAIVEAALEAGDAVDAALRAPTKAETVRYWQRVWGPSFHA